MSEHEPSLVNLSRDLSFFFSIWVGQLFVVAYAVADVLIVGNRRPDLLGALALGNAIYGPLGVIMTAFFSSITINASRIIAEKSVATLKYIAYYGFASGIFAAAFFFCVMKYFSTVHHWSNQSPDLVVATQDYLDALTFSALPFILFRIIACIANSIRATAYITALQGIGLIAKITLSLALVDSPHFQLGLIGCGLSTTIAFYIMGIGATLLFLFDRRFSVFRFDFFLSREPSQLVVLLRTGLPVAFSTLSEVAAFGYMTILISKFDADQLSAHQIVSNVYNVGYTLVVSLAVLFSVKISQAFGIEGQIAAGRKARTAIFVTMAVGFLLASLHMFFGAAVFRLHTADERVLSISNRILIFLSLVIFVDCLQTSAAAALRALGINAFPAFVQIISLWIGVAVLGDGFATQRLWLGSVNLVSATGVWCGVFFGLLPSALIMSLVASGGSKAICKHLRRIISQCTR
ncbi:putative MATE family efflux protein [Paraburkholderia sp. HC6.4b]|uniref:MATE family efflux transporter n=1 Tax=unclassified Paraburkholderia TaxID=2615204 RepID=UPI001828B95C|nr:MULTISPECIES: MATE family efflux transporter [unclassified Paraburkholderia]MBB5411139.1 putative MATE family efflux protein [Paraburkholderia sp. HC6.4b]MBB5453911.1 putative MATE family efflux protein [Paraburkholderia sp. Kb1A]